MKLIRLAALLAGCALLASGCAFHRGNVPALSKEQDSYYAKLEETLTKGRPNLVDALAKQLQADRVRQGNLLEWERDLAKTEVLLQVNANTSGNRKLLLLKTTESDLKSLSQVQALQEIDHARQQAILDLYDGVIKATKALRNNNRPITEYLSGGNAVFALRSLDIQGVVTAVSTLEDVQNQLKGVQVRSDQEKIKENQRLQSEIERARDVVLKALQTK